MRYFVDHGTIHDQETGKHVSPEEAAAMLSAMPAMTTSGQRIAWSVVIELGRMLHKSEEQIELREFVIERVQQYTQRVRSEPLGMESVNPDIAALLEQARRYVAEVVLDIIETSGVALGNKTGNNS